MRIILYFGKGGVGKTSIAAATAARLAESGRRVMAMSTDLAHSLGDSFGIHCSGRPVSVMPGLDILEIDPQVEGERVWGKLRAYLAQLMMLRSGNRLEIEETLLFPGLEELFSLLQILDAGESGRYDVIIVDCAPTGETLSLLRYPERLLTLTDRLLPSVRRMTRLLGPMISRQTQVPKPEDDVFAEFEVLVRRLHHLEEVLRDRHQTTLRIVMNPERIVIDEACRAYMRLQQLDFGVDAVYMNKLYPEEALEGYFSAWISLQKDHLSRAKEAFKDQRFFELPLQPREIRGVEMLREAAEQLYGSEDPAQIFSLAGS